jgi:hypothetical protein
VTKVNCSTSFILATRFPKIIWCGRSTLLSICPGFAVNCSSLFVDGRPSIDPELMIRMLVVGYVFAIRSERLICREVQVNLAYRWFCKLGIEDAIPDHSAFLARPQRALSARESVFRRVFERVVEACIAAVWLGRRLCGRREPDRRPMPTSSARSQVRTGAGIEYRHRLRTPSSNRPRR